MAKEFIATFAGPVQGGVIYIKAINAYQARQLAAEAISADEGISRREDRLLRALDSIEVEELPEQPTTYARMLANGDY